MTGESPIGIGLCTYVEPSVGRRGIRRPRDDGGVPLDQPHPVHVDIGDRGNNLRERSFMALPGGAAAGQRQKGAVRTGLDGPVARRSSQPLRLLFIRTCRGDSTEAAL